MNVSLVIPTYNKLPRLRLTMASLMSQTYPARDYKIIVVDDGSFDGTESFIRRLKLPSEVRYIRTENRGRAAARNTGIEATNAGLIIFIDDDLILSPDFISEHVAFQKANNCVVHGRIINLSHLRFFEDPTRGTLYSTFAGNDRSYESIRKRCISETDITSRFDKVFKSEKRLTRFEKAIRLILTQSGHEELSWVGFTGGNVSVTKDRLLDVGGFDTEFGLEWGCEDLELGYRLFLEGNSFRYSEKALNFHIAHYRNDFRTVQKRNFSYFFDKHKDERIILVERFLAGEIGQVDLLAYGAGRKNLGVCAEEGSNSIDCSSVGYS